MFYLARHLPIILRQEKQSISILPEPAIYDVIRSSFNYIVDTRADLEIIFDFAANRITNTKNIYTLFETIG